LHDKNSNTIHIVERVDGQRLYQEYPAEYIFYYDDPSGKHKTIYGNYVTQYRTRSLKDFQKEIKLYSSKRLWESDINPVFRCLSDNYLGQKAPKLHAALFDIEVAFHPERGYAPPEDPFNRITAISVYLSWVDKCITLVMPPAALTLDEARKIADTFEDTIVFEKEGDMLETFLDLIEDADVLSGWNSEGFDIPYTINRITRVLSRDDTRRMCLWGQFPKRRTFERFGAEQETYDLIGRVHMDYMQLYRKYNYEERHSYSLDAIGEYEDLGSKVAYEGTLEQLYNNDWRKFIDYNKQDVMLMVKLDKKLKFLDLANTIAHENTVLLPTVMGAVAVTEQAIINAAHEQGLIVPNRKARVSKNKDSEEDHGAAGAYVAYPKKGLHEWIGGLDINSLYPSVIRALNMAPETIIAQLRPTYTDKYIKDKIDKGSSFAEAWEGMFGTLEYQYVMAKDPAVMIMIDWDRENRTTEHSAAEIHNLLFAENRPWALSANGTIFTTEQTGIVPGLLARWYAERKTLQAEAKKHNGVDAEQYEYYDKLQLVKKINLNSLYGALLNKGCRFEDHRIGQSTTLTGRVIVKHMAARVNEILDGDYNYVGRSIQYGDTDSVIFTAWPVLQDRVASGEIEWTKETVVHLYDQIGAAVNESFPEFMVSAFHCPFDNGKIIRCGRELVGTKGLFITKKRYAILIYDKEGKRLDVGGRPGRVKAMGLDLKRSDTPKIVQEFLSDLLLDILNGKERDHAVNKIIEFKEKFQALQPWHKGTPKRVNNLTSYKEKESKAGRANMPGHVRAALNWNNLRELNKDNYAMRIVDGQKVIVCKLRNNPLGYTSVAYPIDEQRLPQWFLELPFDDSEMEAAIVDKKVDNLLNVLKWDLAHDTNTKNSYSLFFC
jgi:DNA polymerase elongation subunit (family B)